MAFHNDLGHEGEQMAADYLLSQGYRILHRNWKNRRGRELDIVAQKDDVLAFVEVKSRANEQFGRATDSIDYWKIQRIVSAADSYLRTYHVTQYQVRFDVITVIGMAPDVRIQHIPDAFVPPVNCY